MYWKIFHNGLCKHHHQLCSTSWAHQPISLFLIIHAFPPPVYRLCMILAPPCHKIYMVPSPKEKRPYVLCAAMDGRGVVFVPVADTSSKHIPQTHCVRWRIPVWLRLAAAPMSCVHLSSRISGQGAQGSGWAPTSACHSMRQFLLVPWQDILQGLY